MALTRSRRSLLRLLPAAALMPMALLSSNPRGALAQPISTTPGSATGNNDRAFRRKTPPGFESLPSIGMGTWLTFDIGDNALAQEQRRMVLERFFAAGG